MIHWVAERRERVIEDRREPVWTVAAEQVMDAAGVVQWDVALYRLGVRVMPPGPNLVHGYPGAEMARLELSLDAMRIDPIPR